MKAKIQNQFIYKHKQFQVGVEQEAKSFTKINTTTWRYRGTFEGKMKALDGYLN